MNELRQASWWDALLVRLVDEPASGLAGEFDVSLEDLEAALVESSLGGPVTEEPWWPEVVRRIMDGAPLREMARRFQAKPRRLRRGLARAGVRAGGQRVGDDGLPALRPYRDRLGKEPDSDIAYRARVTPEAVQGERRRLGIAAFRPGSADTAIAPESAKAPAAHTLPPAAHTLPPAADGLPPAADDLPPAADDQERLPPFGDERPRRPRRRWDVSQPQVIHRPTSARFGNVGRALGRHSSPDSGTVPGGPPSAGNERHADARGRGSTGRRRIVRPEPRREQEAPAPKPPPVRRKAEPVHGVVRELTTADIPAAEIDDLVDSLPSLGADSGRQERGASTSQPEPMAVSPEPEVLLVSDPSSSTPVSPSVVVPVPAPAVPAPAASAPAASALAAPVPSRPQSEQLTLPLVAKPVSSPTVSTPSQRPAPVAMRVPEPDPRPPSAPRLAWRVSVDDQVQPFLVVAEHMEAAVRLIQQRLTGEQLSRASIWQVGPLLAGPLV